MIFKRKQGRQARVARPSGDRLYPRLSALINESWWLLVVAAFVYLALTLATYQRSDPGWSFSGTGEAIRNKGGAVGAWVADLMLYLFGLSAWWWVVGSPGARRLGNIRPAVPAR